jgi:hypothetical protein
MNYMALYILQLACLLHVHQCSKKKISLPFGWLHVVTEENRDVGAVSGQKGSKMPKTLPPRTLHAQIRVNLVY